MLKQLTDGESIVAPPNKLTAVHFNKYFSSTGSTTISHFLTTDDNNTETQFSGEDQIALLVLISMIYILKQLGNNFSH